MCIAFIPSSNERRNKTSLNKSNNAKLGKTNNNNKFLGRAQRKDRKEAKIRAQTTINDWLDHDINSTDPTIGDLLAAPVIPSQTKAIIVSDLHSKILMACQLRNIVICSQRLRPLEHYN